MAIYEFFSGRQPEPCPWASGAGLALAEFLERDLGLGHLGEFAAFVKDDWLSLCPASPGLKSVQGSLWTDFREREL